MCIERTEQPAIFQSTDFIGLYRSRDTCTGTTTGTAGLQGLSAGTGTLWLLQQLTVH